MIFVIGNEKGGVGKSMLSINIAAAIQETGNSVVLVDTDTTATTSGWHARRLARHFEPEIPVVAARDHPEKILLGLASQYDNLVIDVGARDYTKIALLAKVADFWLAPSQVSTGDMDSTLRLYEVLRTLGVHRSSGRLPFAVVLNRTPIAWTSTEETDAREYLRAIAPGMPILDQTLRERRAWRDMDYSGHSLLELPRREAAKAIDEFRSLFAEITQMIKSISPPPEQR